MEVAGKLLRRAGKWEYTGLSILVLLVLTLHFSTIAQPPALMFDEQFYVPDARQIIQGNGTIRGEHPPLAKLFIISGMLLFGDNPFGWRFFAVLFGAVAIVLFYLVCRRLALSRRTSFLAAFLLSFENLSFVQASVAMLDVYGLVFMLGAFLLYLKGKYLGAGVSIALSALCKLTGALAAPVILLHMFFAGKPSPRQFLLAAISPVASFLVLMPAFEFITEHRFVEPVARIRSLLELSASVTVAKFPSEIYSRPWEWVLQPRIITYWITPRYVGMISPTLWALILPAVAYLAFNAVKRSRAAFFAICWFTGTYLLWIPASLMSDRTTYVFYFYPTVGAICIGLAMAFSRLAEAARTGKSSKTRWWANAAAPVFVLLHLVAFVILAPVTWWWKVPLAAAAYALARWQLGTEPPDTKQEEVLAAGA